MIGTTFHKTGLVSCMLLVLLTQMPVLSGPARGDDGSGGSVVVTGPLTRTLFEADPNLLLSVTDIGANVASLIGEGVDPSLLSSVLASGGRAVDPQVLQNLQPSLTPPPAGGSPTASQPAAANLINGLMAGNIPPEIAKALSTVSNLGNIVDLGGIQSLLGSAKIKSVLTSLTGINQGYAIDSILSTALNRGGLSAFSKGAGLSNLAAEIATAAPGLATALGGVSGITAALGPAITALMRGGSIGLGGGGLGAAATIAMATPSGCDGCRMCQVEIPKHHVTIRSEITKANTYIKTEITTEFEKYRGWLLTEFWKDNIAKAMMLMAEQLTATGLLQVEIIGTFLDAKHQLETQRLFQTLQAKAHKDYQPSEGMCTFGTTVRSLAGSERRSDLAHTVFADRMMQRQVRSGDVLSTESGDSDIRSRAEMFIADYCDEADNANGLGFLCQTNVPSPTLPGIMRTAVPSPERRNIDINYTRNMESRLTLDLDFTPATGASVTPDEQDVFALSANLFSHDVVPHIQPELLGTKDGKIRESAAQRYMDLRSVFAKRSVAQNSFSALAAMRAAGSPESAPYVKAVIRDLGVSNPDDIEKLLGKNPSYFAQMEVLTKKLYEDPVFYTELYDKPVNVERKAAALQAIGLMQDRDLYDSLLRSEAILSVLLETMLQEQQRAVVNAMGNINAAGRSR